MRPDASVFSERIARVRSSLLQDGVDALLVPPNAPPAMANAVQRILTDPQLAQKLSTNARRKAEGFSWQVVYPLWERLISQVLQEAG